MSETTNRQFMTFHIAGRLYGIDVLQVQEVTKCLPIAEVPLAPKFVCGLINLRGQISTAISLRELFQIAEAAPPDQMNVVCKLNDVLISFLVDRVGDVLELNSKDFELAPETVPDGIRRFIEGVYKTPATLMSVVDVDKIADYFANATKELGSDLLPLNRSGSHVRIWPERGRVKWQGSVTVQRKSSGT